MSRSTKRTRRGSPCRGRWTSGRFAPRWSRLESRPDAVSVRSVGSRPRPGAGSRSRDRCTTRCTPGIFETGWPGRRKAPVGRRLGVMGGTFDPIHYGHLVTAEEALEQFGLDEVVFVPTGHPWMKEHEVISPAEDRYLMTVIATASNPLFSVSRVEVDREGPTYTIDTLRELRQQAEGDIDLFFVTGADAMLEILHWKDPEEVLAQAHFIAATRPGYDLARFQMEAPPGHARISVMDVPALAISSTDVRRR